MLSEDERERLDDEVGEIYGYLILKEGLSFREAKRTLRESVNCFVGHICLD